MQSRLTSKLSHLFPPGVRGRGQAYYDRKSVKIVSGTAVRLVARVLGTGVYDVEAEWEAGEFSLYCSCPYFETDGPCKHIWAAILAAQSRDYLSAVEDIRHVSERGFLGEDEDKDEEDDDLEGSLFPFRVAGALRRAPEVRKPPQWKVQIDGLRNTASVDAFRKEWPARRQLVYVVDLPGSVSLGQVVVNLNSRERKLDGTFGRLNSVTLQRDQIASLPTEEDREIVAAMGGAGIYSGYGYGGSSGPLPASTVIHHPLAARLIPKLLRTGRSFTRGVNHAESASPLVWDEEGPWRFEMELGEGETDRRAA